MLHFAAAFCVIRLVSENSSRKKREEFMCYSLLLFAIKVAVVPTIAPSSAHPMKTAVITGSDNVCVPDSPSSFGSVCVLVGCVSGSVSGATVGASVASVSGTVGIGSTTVPCKKLSMSSCFVARTAVTV